MKNPRWKKRLCLFAAALLAACLFAGCSAKSGVDTAEEAQQDEAEAVSASLEDPASEPETEEKEIDFQAILDAVPADSKYAGCRRYVIVSDYDGDGKREAFGFFGIWSAESQGWTQLKLYFIHSDGQVEAFNTAENAIGAPAEMTGPDQTDFSNNLITLGKNTFLDFVVGYPGSEYRWYLFGVSNGSYTSMTLDGPPEKTSENTVTAEDLDDRVTYENIEGSLVETSRVSLSGTAGTPAGGTAAPAETPQQSAPAGGLSAAQLQKLAASLGVPEGLDLQYVQSSSYWEGGGCWTVNVMIGVNGTLVASATVNQETGELLSGILVYSDSGYGAMPQ